MNNPRTFLLAALFALAYLMWSQWQTDYAPKRVVAGTAPAVAAQSAGSATAETPHPGEVPHAGELPSADAAPNAVTVPETIASTSSDLPLIVVTTDVLRVKIDPRGGSVVSAELLDYPQDPKDKTLAVDLLNTDPTTYFVAQSGLVSGSAAAPDHTQLFSATQMDYTLPADSGRIEVPLTWQADGITVRKVFVFERGSYVIDQQQQISNQSGSDWSGKAYRQLQRVPPHVDTSGIKMVSNTERYSFIGAAWYSPQDKFEKRKFEKFSKDPLERQVTGGWVGMLQHYFFAAWIPPADEVDTFATQVVGSGAATRYLVRATSPTVTVPVGGETTLTSRLYVGPKLQSTLAEVAPGLELTVDYGIFTVISQPLHWVLAKLHALTGNWGFAIILLVLLIKAAFFKLSEAQYRSMAKMRKMQPRVAALKERFGDDKQKVNAAMLDLYKKEKINPLGGCLPMLVQIPVFFALYWVLLESVELRQAPFILWIQNLTAPDPYYVLPVINGAAMLATQWISPMTGMDPMQAKMMKFMPVIFSVMFAFFPAGLVLYWTVNGLLSLAQQWIITKRIENEPAAAK